MSSFFVSWWVTFGGLTAALADAPGFDKGNLFLSQTVSGSVTVNCNDPVEGFSTASYRCEGYFLSPSNTARFQTADRVDADRVVLTAYHADGSNLTKSSTFDRRQGRSGSFNLWIRTLTQRPLLEMGANRIDYVLQSAGKTLQSGTFDVRVEPGRRLTCYHEQVFSSDANDCRNSSRDCEQYFGNARCQ